MNWTVLSLQLRLSGLEFYAINSEPVFYLPPNDMAKAVVAANQGEFNA